MTFWKDLIVLASDGQMEAGLRSLLKNRAKALGVRPISFDTRAHGEHDPGCWKRGDTFLQSFAKQYAHGLVVFDHEGSGQERVPIPELERLLGARLAERGWGDRAAVVVIEPELEAWVWTDSPKLEHVLGWRDHQPRLRSWLGSRGLWNAGDIKPSDPKNALEAALAEVQRPRSASIYDAIGSSVGLASCVDPAFIRLKTVLQSWFPLEG